MASSGADEDLEAQTSGATVSLPTTVELEDDPPTNPPNPQPLSSADPQFQVINTSELANANPPVPQTVTVNNSEVQRDENHGDSSDGLWSLYLTEAEKQDKEVIENWKGDTEGILVFTGLFSATVATFIIESLQNLSPDSGDTTNALLTQITQQLVNISSGAPLTNIAPQSGQSFKPTASAVRVNVLWFLSLILSLNCALSATLMQQWARRYQELAQRPGAFHKRGRMRAYIFDGTSRFGMTRVIATMPTLLHLSVFLFFAGLVEFLFPIYPIVAYATLGCIMAFALPYAILTALPNIHLNCPYSTPLSAITWRISQLSVIIFLQTILEIRNSFSKLRTLAKRQAAESHGLQKWRDALENKVKMRRQWFSQGIRRSVELSAYRADSTVVTNALEWTLAALDEAKEIEDFTARIPGFFNSRVVTDATEAVLSLMSHERTTVPVFGSRLCDLLETCIPQTSLLDEKMRKNRLRVCLNCLWHFGRAYNLPESFQPLPAYFSNSLMPEITPRVRTEVDSGVRVLGRCFEALIVNKLAADIDSRISAIRDTELACLSAILGTKSRDVELYFSRPGAVALANLISFVFVDTSIFSTIPSDSLDVVQQTLGILSQPLSTQESTELKSYQPIAIINASNGNLERILLYRLHDLLCTCIAATSLDNAVRTSCLQMCLRGLWHFGRASNQIEHLMALPSYIYIPFLKPEVTHHIRSHTDPTVYVMGHCVMTLVVNRLVADINTRTFPVNDAELVCLSAILGIDSDNVIHWLNHNLGAIHFANIIFLMDDVYDNDSWSPTSDVLGVVRQTLSILSRSLPAQSDAEMRLGLTDIEMEVSQGTSSLSRVVHSRVIGMCLKNLWNFTRMCIERTDSIPLPSYIFVAFTHPSVTRCILEKGDIAAHVIRRSLGALVVNKLTADINAAPTLPINDADSSCLSAILGIDSHDVTHWLNNPGAIYFANTVFLILDNISDDDSWSKTPDVLDVIRQTFSLLSEDLPAQLGADIRLDLKDTLMEVTKWTTSLSREVRSRVIGMCLKNLWDFTRMCIERGNSMLSYIFIAFTHPRITRCILEKGDVTAHVSRRCVGALVVHKLAADIKSGIIPVSDAELACLSAILHSESRDLGFCLTEPGTVELVNMALLAFGHVDSLDACSVQLDLQVMLHQTLRILSQDLLAQNAEVYPAGVVAPSDISIDRIKYAIVSRLHGLLKIYLSGTSPLTKEVRTSCLRMCLKTLWLSGNAYHHTSDPLPPYFPLMLASPEMFHHFQTEQDPVAHLTGCCFGALISSKLMDTLDSESPVSFSTNDQDAKLACILAILGRRHHEELLTPHHIRIINFRKVVSLILGEIDTLFADSEGMPVDTLLRDMQLADTAKLTLRSLADRLRDSRFIPGGLPLVQRQLLQETYSDIEDALGLYRRKHETVMALTRLSRKLAYLLSAGGEGIR